MRAGGGAFVSRGRGVVAMVAAGLLAAVAVPVAGRVAHRPDERRPAAAPQAPKLPVLFEPEAGQAGQGFLARGSALGMALSPTEARFTVGDGDGAARMSLRVEGASPNARLRAGAKQVATSNYFVGNDPAQWRRDVPTFGKVVSEGVYPGIDLAWYAAGKGKTGLEFDFIVAPGAAPDRIALTVSGARAVDLDGDGALVSTLEGGQILRQHRPVAYQHGAGGRRTPVDAAFRLDGNRVSFTVGPYDSSRELVIDPVIEWSTFFGSSSSDFGNSIALDAAGNIYVSGNTSSSSSTTIPFPVTDTSTPKGSGDIWVSKFSPAGTLLYSTRVGGTANDINNQVGRALNVSPSGIVHVVGQTVSTDFPQVNPQAPCPLVLSGSNQDVFAFKLDPAGSTLLYSTCIGGGGGGGVNPDIPSSAALDAKGNLYISGFTFSQQFPTLKNAAFAASGVCLNHLGDPGVPDLKDAFVLKLNATGTMKWSTCWGGVNTEEARGMDIDPGGNVYVGGWTNSTSFPLKRNVGVQAGMGSSEDGWLMKITQGSDGVPRPKFSTYIGGNDISDVRNVVAKGPYVYVSGGTGSTDFATKWPAAWTGAAQTSNAGGFDSFIARLRFEAADPHAPIMDRITYLGGSGGRDYPWHMVVRAGSLWLTGTTASTTFPVVGPLAGTACAPTASSGALPQDPWIARLNTALTSVTFSTCFGGASTGTEEGRGIAVDSAGNAYVTGYTRVADFPTTAGAYSPTYVGGTFDAYVAKISSNP